MSALGTSREQGAPGLKKFLIVVDGNSQDLFRTGMLLQRLDYHVFTAGNAEEALQYLSIARPAALVTELLLPTMNGMDLINRVKLDGRTKDMPIVVLTSMKDPKVEEMCLVAGCAAYLRKPVEHNALYRTIQHAIEVTPRHYIRLSTCFKLEIADDPSPAAARNECVTALSENGIFVMTYRPRPANSLLSLCFYVENRPVKVRAVVLYAVTTAGGPLKEPGMGLKFVDISNEDRAFLQRFINDQVTKDLASTA